MHVRVAFLIEDSPAEASPLVPERTLSCLHERIGSRGKVSWYTSVFQRFESNIGGFPVARCRDCLPVYPMSSSDGYSLEFLTGRSGLDE